MEPEKAVPYFGTVENPIFSRLNELEQIHREEKVFVSYADTWTLETGEKK